MLKSLRILLIALIVLPLSPVQAQDRELTLQESVIGPYTNLRLKTWPQYGWVPSTNSYWFIDGEGDATALYKAAAVNQEKELVLAISELNNQLPDSAKIKRFPRIHWYNSTTFYFLTPKKRGLVSYSTETKKLTRHYRFPADAEGIDISTSSFNAAYTKGNQLFITNSEGTEIAIGQENVQELKRSLDFYRMDLQRQAKEDNLSDAEVQKMMVAHSERVNHQIQAQNAQISFGKAVHRYEFGIEKGTFWSNNGTKLAFYRNDESAVQDYPLPNFLADYAENKTVKYPMAGQESEQVLVGIYDVPQNNVVYLENQWKEREYITNIAWDPTDKFIYTIELNRDQNVLQLNKYDGVSGNFIKTVLTQKDDKYVHPDRPVYFLENGDYLYTHEKNGVRQFDYITQDDKVLHTISTRNVIVEDILGHHGKKLIFSGIEQESIQQHIYEISLEVNTGNSIGISSGSSFKGTKVYQLSGKGGVHSGKVNFNAEYILDAFRSTETPYQLDLITVKNRKRKALVTPENPYNNYQLGQTEIVELKAEDGTKLFSRIIKPHNFDKKQQYPVLVYVYNGPNVQLINDSWLNGASLWMHYLANQGYIVYTLDGRGSYHRGAKFEQATFRQLGQLEMKDQLVGVDYLKSLSYVDADKMAVHGWSYGGFMTISLMTNYPDVFKVGVAGGPVTDWSLYEVMYTERYMDTPATNADGFEKTSVLNKAGELKGDLLLIHGTDDDVVVPQHSMKFLKASVDAGVQVDFFMYPGHKHNVGGMDRIHLIEKVINYVEKHLN